MTTKIDYDFERIYDKTREYKPLPLETFSISGTLPPQTQPPVTLEPTTEPDDNCKDIKFSHCLLNIAERML